MAGPDRSNRSSVTRYRASWLLPITSRPIRDAWLDVCDGAISGWGGSAVPDASPVDRSEPPVGPDRVVELSGHVLLPTLVNAHTHLELSGLRARVPPASTMPGWARQVMRAIADHRPQHDASMGMALEEARTSGTGLVGDISNTGVSVGPMMQTGAPGVVFLELLGFDVQDGTDTVARALAGLGEQIAAHPGPGEVRPGLAAHAPYSVSPAVFRAIRRTLDVDLSMRISVHLAESPEELEFLQSGGGAWRAILEERGRWSPDWTPHQGGPVSYLDSLGWLTERTLVVHGVHLEGRELERLAEAGTTVVTCPRSNQWTGAGVPPVDRFYASGVRVAVGTDSLASAPDLELFREMAVIRRLAPAVPAGAILESATRVGAEALGFSDRGAIEVGKRAALVAVRCPDGLDDVEEYLLTGIGADQVMPIVTPDPVF